jgi:acylphosphatase
MSAASTAGTLVTWEDAPNGTASGQKAPPGSQARLTAWIRGRVQGVGFRWWVRSMALELGLRGEAENLVDGRVRVIAEGERESCAVLLERLEAPGAPGHVVQVTHRWDSPRGGFTGFLERLAPTAWDSSGNSSVTCENANLTGRVLRWDHGDVTCAQLTCFVATFLARATTLVTQCGGPQAMAKALLGHVGGPDPRMVSEMRRLQRRVRDLEAELARLQEVNDVLAAGVGHEMLLDDREPALT